MSTSKDSSKGQAIINELASLLRSKTFSTSEGELFIGEAAQVLIDPRWNEDTQDYQLLITCHVFQQLDVALAGMPLVIKSNSEDTVTIYIVRFDNRGQAFISHLPLGNYSVSISPKWYFSETPIINANSRVAIRHRGESEQACRFQSNDSRITVTATQSMSGQLSLHFQTQYPELKGATIEFAIIQPSGEVLIFDKIRLIESEPHALYKGDWTEQLMINTACHLMFEVTLESTSAT